MSDQPNANRRKFLRQASAAVAAIPVVSMAGISAAQANEKAEDGHAHEYVKNAADAAGHDDYAEGSKCKKCAFWGGDDAEWGQCYHADFQGVEVNANGWCSEFVEG
ncbi:MAG: high-potential iron-sulfur protein [Thioalkalivibrio sp.]|uniref:high-potential iron-sulfur protein n=2 Tax=Thioalkalivibrio sp. TaxID=2093813 RepID=UPI003974CB0B